MFGFGSGFSASWEWRANPRLCARLAKAINAHQYDEVERCLAPDFIYFDTVFNRIDGGSAYVEALRRLHQKVPDLKLLNITSNEHDGVVLVRGQMVSKDTPFSYSSLWHVCIEQGRISQVQAFRDQDAISLPGFVECVTPATA